MDEIKDLKCPICGEPTNVYMGKARKDRLCKKHGKMRNDGLIDVNADGFFFEVATGTILNPPKIEKKPEPVKETKNSADKIPQITCLFCKKDSNGMHFCKECYHTYKDREMDIHIKNLIEWTITDEYGNQKIQCKNGMKVRSRAEKIIADFFFDHKIRAIYETDIPYKHKDKVIILNPDFYLPDYGEIDENGRKRGLIIEYNELETPQYIRTKNFTQKGYEEMGFEVLVLTTEDINNDLLKLKIRFDIV